MLKENLNTKRDKTYALQEVNGGLEKELLTLKRKWIPVASDIHAVVDEWDRRGSEFEKRENGPTSIEICPSWRQPKEVKRISPRARLRKNPMTRIQL